LSQWAIGPRSLWLWSAVRRVETMVMASSQRARTAMERRSELDGRLVQPACGTLAAAMA
jgi:hypothetical protein